jgi:tRNA1(Val) A37 N6-methylase TrmN6
LRRQIRFENNEPRFYYVQQYDLIVANPPYAKLLENGKRASKNHNLIKVFIEKTLEQLKPNTLYYAGQLDVLCG